MSGMRRLEGHGGWALRDGGRAMEGDFGSWGEGKRRSKEREGGLWPVGRWKEFCWGRSSAVAAAAEKMRRLQLCGLVSCLGIE